MDIARPSGSDEILDSRGVAIADLDLDGRLDFVINNNNGPASVYLNRLETAGNWVGLSLEGDESNRSAVGARVILTAGGKTMYRAVEAGSGFSSQAPLSLHIGMGRASGIEALEVHWPSGRVDRFPKEKLETYINCNLYLREGTGALELSKLGPISNTSLTGSSFGPGGGAR